MQQPYLTIDELAAELGCSLDAACDLIEKGDLPGVERSPGSLVVPRLALDAYRRRIAGEGLPVVRIKIDDKSPEESRAAFEAKTDMSPAQWIRRWSAEEIEDSAENMKLTIDAYGVLNSEGRLPLECLRPAAAACKELAIRSGLSAVSEVEAELGTFTAGEVAEAEAWAKEVIGRD